MAGVRFTNVVLFINFLTLVTSSLLCYDCDAGDECVNPLLHNVRTVNCNAQYPPEQNNGQLVCLTLDIAMRGSVGTRGFNNIFKSGYYRGCRVIPDGEGTTFCENIRKAYMDRFVINSCKFCNTTRCIP